MTKKKEKPAEIVKAEPASGAAPLAKALGIEADEVAMWEAQAAAKGTDLLAYLRASLLPRPAELWAAYSGSALGSEISLYPTQLEALWACVRDLGLDEDDRGLTETSDADALRDALDHYCSTRADDWHVNEVTLP